MKPLSRIIIGISLVVLCIFGIWQLISVFSTDRNGGNSTGQLPRIEYQHKVVTINGKEFDSQLADTDELRELGLGLRKSLSSSKGLLFVFDRDSYLPFWMKDMNFSIDIIWIDANKKIVHIEQNISPETYPTTFESPTPARYVFEISAGMAQKLHMKLGDDVLF